MDAKSLFRHAIRLAYEPATPAVPGRPPFAVSYRFDLTVVALLVLFATLSVVT